MSSTDLTAGFTSFFARYEADIPWFTDMWNTMLDHAERLDAEKEMYL